MLLNKNTIGIILNLSHNIDYKLPRGYLLKFLNSLSVLILFCVSFSQDSFDLEIESTGVSQLIIFQNSITGLEPGDEIGVLIVKEF